jgi:hypothetical protein
VPRKFRLRNGETHLLADHFTDGEIDECLGEVIGHLFALIFDNLLDDRQQYHSVSLLGLV